MKKTPKRANGLVRDKSLYIIDEDMILQVVKITKLVGMTSTALNLERALLRK
jgi:rRNA processing protein Krr1/Pno1